MDMIYGEETMTVAELIAELQKLPPDFAVVTEGCDCYGTAQAVGIDRDYADTTVVIARSKDYAFTD